MLLALPQGTGKTIISLASTERLLEMKYIERVLILCPTGIGWQWLEKIKEFTDCEDVRLVEAKNKSSREYGTNEAVYTIVPYSVFRKDYKAIMAGTLYDLVIADEAQEFSNFRSRTFKLIKKLRSPYRWALTGTAISNKLEELYAILQWVDPSFLPPWKTFEKAHLVRNPYTKQILSYKNLEGLNTYLASKRLDRKTIDELSSSLPEVITHKMYIEKDREVKRSEHELYNLLSANRGGSRTSRRLIFDPAVSSQLTVVRQTLCSSKLGYAAGLLQRIINDSESNRIIVFSFYKQPLYDLQSLLLRHDISTAFFTGDQSGEEKQGAVKAFREGAKVLLASNAGKAGLDLPFANYTIHLDVPFSFGVTDQRSTRTRRAYSKHKTVVVIYLLVKDSIEEYFYQVTINKGKLARATLEGGDDHIVMKPETLTQFLKRHYDTRRKGRAV